MDIEQFTIDLRGRINNTFYPNTNHCGLCLKLL